MFKQLCCSTPSSGQKCFLPLSLCHQEDDNYFIFDQIFSCPDVKNVFFLNFRKCVAVSDDFGAPQSSRSVRLSVSVKTRRSLDKQEPTWWRDEGPFHLILTVSVHQKPIARFLPSAFRPLAGPAHRPRLSLSRPRHRRNLLSLVHRCDQCLCATRLVCGGLVQPFLMTGEIILIIELCKPLLALFFSCTHAHTHKEHKSMHTHTHACTFSTLISAAHISGREKKSVWLAVRGNM